MWARAAVAIIVLAMINGCSDDGGGAADAGTPDQAAADVRPDAPPPDGAPDLPPADLPLPDAPCPDPGVALASGITVSPTNLAAGGQVTIVYGPPAKLAGAANLGLHHGFNHWGLDLGGAKAKDVAMSKRADGAFEVTIPVPTGARLLDFVFFTQSGSTKQWDNNGKADYHRSVGVPRIGPYLTLRDNLASPGQADRDPAHSIVVNFRTDWPCLGRVHYGTAPLQLTASQAETTPATDHHLHLKGLKADTVYHYRTSCVDAAASCPVPETGPVHSFRTAPKSATGLKLVLLADPQDNRAANDRWSDIAQALTKPPHGDARLVVVAGDLAGDDLPVRWWDFFDKGRELFATRPLIPAVGNHDTPTYGSVGSFASFDALFDFDSSSGSDAYHGLRHGPVSFLVLNSETSQSFVSTTDWKPGGKQYGWAKGALSKLTTPWRFAVWHIPPYNAGASHEWQAADARSITALFNDAIDWVFGGHEHLYQRFKPIRHGGLDSSGKVISKVAASHGGTGGGVGYLIAPAAGHDPPNGSLVGASNPMRGLLAWPPASAITNDKVDPWVGFVVVQVAGTSITIQAHELGTSTPRDTLSYTKP